jgi:hypothetical protein
VTYGCGPEQTTVPGRGVVVVCGAGIVWRWSTAAGGIDRIERVGRSFEVKRLCGGLVIVLVAAGGCGGTSGRAVSGRSPMIAAGTASAGGSRASAKPWWEAGYYAENYNRMLYYGHRAGAADRRAVEGVVEGYYAAAASRNGAAECALLAAAVARQFADQQGRAPATRRSCAVAMASFIKENHHSPGANFARMTLAAVRVDGGHGFALLRIGRRPSGTIAVEREGGTWKIGTFIEQVALFPSHAARR